ncbi:hypothetical protein SprV_0200569300 [Sparganum proliferum]
MKTFRIQRAGREEVVGVDRLKASVPNFLSDEPCGPLPSAPPPPPAPLPSSRISPLPSLPATSNCHL